MGDRLSAGVQDAHLRQVWPDFRVTWHREQASWHGTIRPSPLSCVYDVRIDFGLGRNPKVWIISPDLRSWDGAADVPHRYADGSLCLFHPERCEWNAKMIIADTIVPWAALWLFHYENWLATGVWAGGGEHPRRSERQPPRNWRTDD